VASIAFGLIAAYYWYKASAGKFTPIKTINPYVGTVMEQSRLNKIAAIHTALAVAFQALASLLDAFR